MKHWSTRIEMKKSKSRKAITWIAVRKTLDNYQKTENDVKWLWCTTWKWSGLHQPFSVLKCYECAKKNRTKDTHRNENKWGKKITAKPLWVCFTVFQIDFLLSSLQITSLFFMLTQPWMLIVTFTECYSNKNNNKIEWKTNSKAWMTNPLN